MPLAGVARVRDVVGNVEYAGDSVRRLLSRDLLGPATHRTGKGDDAGVNLDADIRLFPTAWGRALMVRVGDAAVRAAASTQPRGMAGKTSERAAPFSTVRNRSAAFSDSERRRRTDTRRTAGRLLAAALRVKAMSLAESKAPASYPGIGAMADRSAAVVWVETHVSQASCAYPLTPSTKTRASTMRRWSPMDGVTCGTSGSCFSSRSPSIRRRRPRRAPRSVAEGDQLHLRPGTGRPALNREGRPSSDEEEFMTKPLQTKIRSWMSSPVRTVKPLDTAAHARRVLEDFRINQLAVVEEDRLVGIVTDRDLRDAFPSVIDVLRGETREGRRTYTQPEEVSVEMVMAANPQTLGPEDDLGAAARLLRRERIGALPIVENHRLVGILTRSDLLDALLAALESGTGREERS